MEKNQRSLYTRIRNTFYILYVLKNNMSVVCGLENIVKQNHGLVFSQMLFLISKIMKNKTLCQVPIMVLELVANQSVVKDLGVRISHLTLVIEFTPKLSSFRFFIVPFLSNKNLVGGSFPSGYKLIKINSQIIDEGSFY